MLGTKGLSARLPPLLLPQGDYPRALARPSDSQTFQVCGEHSFLFLCLSGHFRRELGVLHQGCNPDAISQRPHMLFNLLYPNTTSRNENENRS